MNTQLPRIAFRTVALPMDANRAFALPADGWYQLATPGEVDAPLEIPGREAAVPVVQILDKQAAETVHTAFRELAAQPNFSGVLVDYEHFSYEANKETKAAAWIDDMQVRGAGELWIKPRITHSGKQALEGGDYRHISPVFLYPPREYKPGERVRPVALDTAGLTNRPRIKGMVPLSNRDDATPAARTDTTKAKAPMKKVYALLGLAEDASEDSVVAAIQALKDKVGQGAKMEGDLQAMTKQRDTLLAAQIERDLDEAGLEGDARKPWQAALLKNRDETLPLLAGIKPAKPAGGVYAVTHNRERTRQPGSVVAAEKPSPEQTQAAETRAAKIRNRASEIQATARSQGRSLSYSQAFSQAEAEIPVQG